MEKFLKITAVALIALCLILSSSATPARADSEGAATVTASALNMRSEASTSGSVITCLPRGTVVLVTGAEGDWYKVSYRGDQGYMSADFLDFSDTADAAFGDGSVTGDAVNIRSGPSTDDEILGTRDKGDTLTVIGVSGSWYKVSLDGADGYIRSDFLSLESGSGTGSSAAEDTSSVDTGSATGGSGTLTATDVRLRSGPSTSHDILDVLNTGDTVTITDEDGDWYKVSYDGTVGYVYKTYVSTGDAASDSQTVSSLDSRTAYVISAVHFRSGPDTSYTSKQVLSSGTEVTVTGETEKWYRVSCNGEEGYIFKTYLSDTAPASSSSEAERIIAEAKKYLGTPYVYGGATPSGFDCSGFVYYVFRQCGYSITRTAGTQNGDGYQVSRSELKPGDIIIFYNSAKTSIGHSGIYIGNGQFIHSSSGQGRVVITDLSASYYDSHYYSARRVLG